MNYKIYQNAIRIISTGQILISHHRHDYVSGMSKFGEVSVDGGKDYIKRLNTQDNPDVEELSLSSLSPYQQVMNNLLWGTYGKNGDEPLTYIFLKHATTDHLKNIMSKLGQGMSDSIVPMVIHDILYTRELKNDYAPKN